jgi:hypothetical protein
MADQYPQFNATWILKAPWAHPVWNFYAFLLYDLVTEIPDQPAPKIYAPGSTHEILVFAMDPEFDSQYPEGRIEALEFFNNLPASPLLQPANYGYQFYARNDEAAEKRIAVVYNMCATKKLSPDTDWRRIWNELFEDAFPLVNSEDALQQQSIRVKRKN